MNDPVTTALRQHFGFDAFRPGQRDQFLPLFLVEFQVIRGGGRSDRSRLTPPGEPPPQPLPPLPLARPHPSSPTSAPL